MFSLCFISFKITEVKLNAESAKSAEITFYVERDPDGKLKGSFVEKKFKILSRTDMWDAIGGEV